MEAPDTQRSGSPDVGQTIGASAEADEAAASASMRRVGAEEARRGVPPRRKLSDEQEREVTRLYAETSTPTAEIARRFGIAQHEPVPSTRCRQSLRLPKYGRHARSHQWARPCPRLRGLQRRRHGGLAAPSLPACRRQHVEAHDRSAFVSRLRWCSRRRIFMTPSVRLRRAVSLRSPR